MLEYIHSKWRISVVFLITETVAVENLVELIIFFIFILFILYLKFMFAKNNSRMFVQLFKFVTAGVSLCW